VAAQNPDTEDYDVFQFLDEAFNDRFIHLKVELSADSWIEWARDSNVHPHIVGFISKQKDMLTKKLSDFNLDQYASPSGRTWGKYGHALHTEAEKKGMLKSMEYRELLQGLIGVEATSMFLDYLETEIEIPKAKDIFDSYISNKALRKRVLALIDVKNRREDILSKIVDDLRHHIKELDQTDAILTRKQEESLTRFIIDLPRDLGKAFLLKVVEECPIFMRSETDKEQGLAGCSDLGLKIQYHLCPQEGGERDNGERYMGKKDFLKKHNVTKKEMEKLG
jgi:hypothetical protein